MATPINPRFTDSPYTEYDPSTGKPIRGSFKKCGANKVVKGDDVPCQNPAGLGTPHPGRGPCKLHYGSTPTIIDKYLVEEAMEHQRAVAAGFQGYPVNIGPHEALLEEVRRTAGKVRYIANMLDFEELDKTQLHEMKRDLFRERTHLISACAVAARAGVEERAIRLAEMWGQEIALLFQAVFADLRLTPEQKEQAPEIVGRHLALMEGN